MISNKRIATILVLFAMTFFAMQHFDDVKSTPILKPLVTFPEAIDGWKLVQKRTLDRSVSDMLGVDDYIDSTYVSSQNDRIDLYVSYFSAVGISGAYHSPQNCLPGGGWVILSVEKIPIDANRTGTINKMIVINGANRKLVYYWYQNRGRIIASEYWDKIYTVIDSIFLRRRDGSFIRVMTDESQEQSARVFSRAVALALRDYLPGG